MTFRRLTRSDKIAFDSAQWPVQIGVDPDTFLYNVPVVHVMLHDLLTRYGTDYVLLMTLRSPRVVLEQVKEELVDPVSLKAMRTLLSCLEPVEQVAALRLFLSTGQIT